MESAGAEPFSAHKPLFQSADGGAGRYAHLSGNLSHPVFLLSLAGRADAHRMLAAADVDDQSCFPVAKDLGAADVCARVAVAAYLHGYGLLDLYPQAARPFLRWHVRSFVCHRHAVGFPLIACETSSQGRMDRTYGCSGLSAGGHLWAGRCPADGYSLMAAGTERPECRL